MPKHRALRVLPCVIVAALAGAPALADEAATTEAAAKPYPEGINCVWAPNHRAQSFYVIDDEHLVIELTLRKRYLVTLTRRCWNLDVVTELGFDTSGSQICGPGDSVITDRDRCMIRYLEEVSSYDEGKAIVANRKAAEKAAREARQGGGN